MPKQTFFNLPEEKRRRLLDLAIEEFAAHDYRLASISRIVARAGIAKGSFYQYFEDKRDLFLYLLDTAVNQPRLDYLRAAQPAPEQRGFFDRLRWMLDGAVQIALAHPQLAQIAMRASVADPPFADEALDRARAMGREYLREMVMEGVARGELAPGLDPELAAGIIFAATDEFMQLFLKRTGIAPGSLANADATVFDTPEAHRLFAEIVRILERGMANPAAPG
jgi:AcrR family transcriptional regulator